MQIRKKEYAIKFLLTRPSRGATWLNTIRCLLSLISTHTPLAGRDLKKICH